MTPDPGRLVLRKGERYRMPNGLTCEARPTALSRYLGLTCELIGPRRYGRWGVSKAGRIVSITAAGGRGVITATTPWRIADLAPVGRAGQGEGDR